MSNLLRFVLPFLLGGFTCLGGVYHFYTQGDNMRIIKTHEPLLISPNSDPEDSRYYVLPAGIVLYLDGGMDEGHVLYHAYFYHKGSIAHDVVPMLPKYKGSLIAPSWLWNIDSDALEGMFKGFPVTKRDVAAAIKASQMTREDLIDIIKSLPE
jgi:hypothetical protein